MKLTSIKIVNFKAFQDVEINLNPHFNFLVGENNIGKSTIFEAIQLWKLGFENMIQVKGKNFYGKTSIRYIPFENLFFLRTTGIHDIFYDPKSILSITLEISHGEEIYKLQIIFEKPTSIDSYLRVKYEGDDFENFNLKVRELGLNLYTAIFIYQTQPVFFAIRNEPFYNNAQLMKKISLGKSNEVLRNKILKGDPSLRRFERLEDRLFGVFEKQIKIRFKNKNLQDEEFIRINIQVGDSKEVDLSLKGSGILQVLDIFATVEYINKRDHGLNLLLIDEPDSHIHANLQSALIDELRKDINNQHLIITHNERLINKAGESELLYLNKRSLALGKVDFVPKESYSSITIDLCSKLFSLLEVEHNKIVVITEGRSDKKILEVAFAKLYPDVTCPYLFIASGIQIDEQNRNGGAETVRRSLEFLSAIYSENKLIGLFDNDREGYERFKGLNQDIFGLHDYTLNHRKHMTKDIYGVVIPVTVERNLFVTANNPTQRYFVIEHYFSDDILTSFNMKGTNILDSTVFEIQGNKINFSESVDTLDMSEFEGFKNLFDLLRTLFPD